MKNSVLAIHKYKLFIFDWDGTLVDSIGSYKLWDKLYVQKFYGIDLPLYCLEDLARKMKTVTIGNAENPYFRYLDMEYGDGKTPMVKIWENVYSLSPVIQGKVIYQASAPEALQLLRLKTSKPIVLATNSLLKDIEFFSSQMSQTAKHLSPIDFFDMVVTSNHVKKPKPHPEIFKKIIGQYGIEPHEVLIFEDSLNGVVAGKAAGADVIAIFCDDATKERADYVLNDWGEMITLLQEDLS